MGSVGETILLGGRVALSLAVVLALMWFIARRLGGRAEPGRRVPITVLGRQSLGRRAGLTVVEVAGRVLVLGVSDSGITMLSDVGDGARAADDVGPAAAVGGDDRAAGGDGPGGDAGRGTDDRWGTDDRAGAQRSPVLVRRDFDALLTARTANGWQPGAAAPNAAAPRAPAASAGTPTTRPGAAALLDPAIWARAWSWRHGTPQAGAR